LQVDDIQIGDEGGARFCSKKSKTDQPSYGHWKHLSLEIRREFGASQVSRASNSLARSRELNDEFFKAVSGHSMWVGAAQGILVNGPSLPQILVKGGWSKTDTEMRYIDKVRPHNSLF
jgi:hypothetical protein